jgi:hypothetical protein
MESCRRRLRRRPCFSAATGTARTQNRRQPPRHAPQHQHQHDTARHESVGIYHSNDDHTPRPRVTTNTQTRLSRRRQTRYLFTHDLFENHSDVVRGASSGLLGVWVPIVLGLGNANDLGREAIWGSIIMTRSEGYVCPSPDESPSTHTHARARAHTHTLYTHSVLHHG